MSRAPRTVLLFPVLFGAMLPFHWGVAREADKNKDLRSANLGKLERGMTPEEVFRLVGSPKQIARQIFYHRYREQWMYEVPLRARVTFDCVRGQKPQLLPPPKVTQEY